MDEGNSDPLRNWLKRLQEEDSENRNPLDKWLGQHGYEKQSNVSKAVHELCEYITDLPSLTEDDFKDTEAGVKRATARTLIRQISDDFGMKDELTVTPKPNVSNPLYIFKHLWAWPLLDENDEPIERFDSRSEQTMLRDTWESFRINFHSLHATATNLIEQSMQCDIAHISAHGDCEGILLEHASGVDNMGKAYCVHEETLKNMKTAGAFKQTKLLVLMACKSEIMGGLFASILDIPSVIAIDSKSYLKDDVAQVFSKLLYCSLAKGYLLKKSFDDVVRKISQDYGEVEALKLKLLPENGQHDLSFTLERGDMVDCSPPDSVWLKQQRHIPGMIGRYPEFETYRYIHNFDQSEKDVVVISGKVGSGKTQIALRVLHHSFERKEFDLYVSVEAETFKGRLPSSIPSALFDEIMKQLNEMDQKKNGKLVPEEIFETLRSKTVLVFLDGFDFRHSNKDLCGVLADLLKWPSKKLRVLATSRLYPVAPNFPPFESVVVSELTAEERAELFSLYHPNSSVGHLKLPVYPIEVVALARRCARIPPGEEASQSDDDLIKLRDSSHVVFVVNTPLPVLASAIVSPEERDVLGMMFEKQHISQRLGLLARAQKGIKSVICSSSDPEVLKTCFLSTDCLVYIAKGVGYEGGSPLKNEHVCLSDMKLPKVVVVCLEYGAKNFAEKLCNQFYLDFDVADQQSQIRHVIWIDTSTTTGDLQMLFDLRVVIDLYCGENEKLELFVKETVEIYKHDQDCDINNKRFVSIAGSPCGLITNPHLSELYIKSSKVKQDSFLCSSFGLVTIKPESPVPYNNIFHPHPQFMNDDQLEDMKGGGNLFLHDLPSVSKVFQFMLKKKLTIINKDTSQHSESCFRHLAIALQSVKIALEGVRNFRAVFRVSTFKQLKTMRRCLESNEFSEMFDYSYYNYEDTSMCYIRNRGHCKILVWLDIQSSNCKLSKKEEKDRHVFIQEILNAKGTCVLSTMPISELSIKNVESMEEVELGDLNASEMCPVGSSVHDELPFLVYWDRTVPLNDSKHVYTFSQDFKQAFEDVIDKQLDSCAIQVADVYVGNGCDEDPYYKQEMIVRLLVPDVKSLQFLYSTFNSKEKSHRKFDTALAELLNIKYRNLKFIRSDSRQHLSYFERALLRFQNLTPQQLQAFNESLVYKRVHFKAPAGGGKTFIALHAITDSILSKNPSPVVFIINQYALAFRVVNLLLVRGVPKDLVEKWLCVVVAERKEVCSDNVGEEMLIAHDVEVRGNRIRLVSKDEDNVQKMLSTDYMLVIDEAHHLFETVSNDIQEIEITEDIEEKRSKQYSLLHEVLEKYDGASSKCKKSILLSDISQSLGTDIYEMYELCDTKIIELTEVIRSSQRVTSACLQYSIANGVDISPTHGFVGPPLKALLFDAGIPPHDEISLVKEYCALLGDALHKLEVDYDACSLHGRLAILFPRQNNQNFPVKMCMSKFKEDLKEKYSIDAITAVEACSVVRVEPPVKPSKAVVTVDYIDQFDGQESLFVIGVGFDQAITSEPGSGVEGRSQLYRAISRAQLMFICINHVIPDGWLVWMLSSSNIKHDMNMHEHDSIEEDFNFKEVTSSLIKNAALVHVSPRQSTLKQRGSPIRHLDVQPFPIHSLMSSFDQEVSMPVTIVRRKVLKSELENDGSPFPKLRQSVWEVTVKNMTSAKYDFVFIPFEDKVMINPFLNLKDELPKSCSCGYDRQRGVLSECVEVGMRNHWKFPAYKDLPKLGKIVLEDTYKKCYRYARTWFFVGEVERFERSDSQYVLYVRSRFGEEVKLCFDIAADEAHDWKWLLLDRESCTVCIECAQQLNVPSLDKDLNSLMVFPSKLDVLMSEYDSILKSSQSSFCAGCKKQECNLTTYCDNCCASYCNEECKKTHWINGHKNLCDYTNYLSTKLLKCEFMHNDHTRQTELSFNEKVQVYEALPPAETLINLRDFLNSIGDKILLSDSTSAPLCGKLSAFCDLMHSAQPEFPPVLVEFTRPLKESVYFKAMMEFVEAHFHNHTLRHFVFDVKLPEKRQSFPKVVDTDALLAQECFLDVFLLCLPLWRQQDHTARGGISWFLQTNNIFQNECFEKAFNCPSSVDNIKYLETKYVNKWIDAISGWNCKTISYGKDPENQNNHWAFTKNAYPNACSVFSSSMPVVAKISEASNTTFSQGMSFNVFRISHDVGNECLDDVAYNEMGVDVDRHISSSQKRNNIFTLWIREDTPTFSFQDYDHEKQLKDRLLPASLLMSSSTLIPLSNVLANESDSNVTTYITPTASSEGIVSTKVHSNNQQDSAEYEDEVCSIEDGYCSGESCDTNCDDECDISDHAHNEVNVGFTQEKENDYHRFEREEERWEEERWEEERWEEERWKEEGWEEERWEEERWKEEGWEEEAEQSCEETDRWKEEVKEGQQLPPSQHWEFDHHADGNCVLDYRPRKLNYLSTSISFSEIYDDFHYVCDDVC